MLSLCPRSEIWKIKFSPQFDRIQTNITAQPLTFNLNHQKKLFKMKLEIILIRNRACSSELTGNFSQSLMRKSTLLFGASHQKVCSAIEQILFCNPTQTYTCFHFATLILAICLISIKFFLWRNLSSLCGFSTAPLTLEIFTVSLE